MLGMATSARALNHIQMALHSGVQCSDGQRWASHTRPNPSLLVFFNTMGSHSYDPTFRTTNLAAQDRRCHGAVLSQDRARAREGEGI